MSFDEWAVNNQNFKALSQSLWNRAMSFDVKRAETLDVDLPVSIPLEQGNVFRQSCDDYIKERIESLNPFGTGQCLSTAVGC